MADVFQFESQEINLGKVENGDTGDTVQFELKILGKPEVSISSIQVNCGCLQFAGDVVGKHMGEVRLLEIPFTLNYAGHVGNKKLWIKVECQGPHGRKENQSIPVLYNVIPLPQVEPNSLVAVHCLGDDAWSGNAVIACMRLDTEPEIKIDWESSRIEPYVGKELSFETFKHFNSDVREDRSSIVLNRLMSKLGPKNDLPDESPDRLNVVLSNGKSVEVNVVRRSVHPIEAGIERLFLGLTETDSKVRKEVELTNQAEFDLEIVDIHFKGNATLSCNESIAIKAQGRSTLVLDFTIGQESGRQLGKLVLPVKHPEIPPLVLEISWVNRK